MKTKPSIISTEVKCASMTWRDFKKYEGRQAMEFIRIHENDLRTLVSMALEHQRRVAMAEEKLLSRQDGMLQIIEVLKLLGPHIKLPTNSDALVNFISTTIKALINDYKRLQSKELRKRRK